MNRKRNKPLNEWQSLKKEFDSLKSFEAMLDFWERHNLFYPERWVIFKPDCTEAEAADPKNSISLEVKGAASIPAREAIPSNSDIALFARYVVVKYKQFYKEITKEYKQYRFKGRLSKSPLPAHLIKFEMDEIERLKKSSKGIRDGYTFRMLGYLIEDDFPEFVWFTALGQLFGWTLKDLIEGFELADFEGYLRSLLEKGFENERLHGQESKEIRIDEKTIPKLFDLLKSFFDKNEWSKLQNALQGEHLDSPLLFRGNANKLGDVFWILARPGSQKVYSAKKSVIAWIVKNFRYQGENDMPTSFDSENLSKVINRNSRLCKNPIPGTDDLIKVLPTKRRIKH